MSLADLPPAATARLRLAPLRLEDAPALRAITDDPLIARAVSFLVLPFSQADAQALIQGKGDGRDCFYGAWSRHDGALVATVGAHLVEDDRIEIGYWVARQAQGNGYAAEAAGAVIGVVQRIFPQRRVVAECAPQNLASWRVLTYLGFRPTGLDGARPGRRLLAL